MLPNFGLPPNYSPLFIDSSRIGLSTEHVVQLTSITEMPPPPVVHTIARGPFNDPRYIYHDTGSHNYDQEDKKEKE